MSNPIAKARKVLVDSRGNPFSGRAPYQHRGLQRNLANIDRPSFLKSDGEVVTVDASHWQGTGVYIHVHSEQIPGQFFWMKPPTRKAVSLAVALVQMADEDEDVQVLCHPSDAWNLAHCLRKMGAYILNEREDWDTIAREQNGGG